MKEKVENHSAKKSRLSKCLYNVLDLFCEIVRDLVRWFGGLLTFFYLFCLDKMQLKEKNS